MNLLSLLDVAVGLILIWLIVSLVVMQVQEWIVGRFRTRARMLAGAIQRMLGARLTQQLYQHQIIRSLSAGKNGAAQPSYIPSEQFAAVALDLICSLGNPAAFLRQQVSDLCSMIAGKRQSKLRKEALPRLQTVLEMLGGGGQAKRHSTGLQDDTEWALSELRSIAADFPAIAADVQALEDKHREVINSAVGDGEPDSAAGRLLSQTKVGLAALAALDPGVGEAMRVVLSSLGQYQGQPETALGLSRQSLQSWFDGAMDRLNGQYKRRAVAFSFLIGFGLAAVLNIDTILLAQFLWRQSHIAAAIADEAQSLLPAGATNLAQLISAGKLLSLQSRFSAYGIPLGWMALPISPGEALTISHLREVCTLGGGGSSGVQGFFVANQCFPLVNLPQASDYLGWSLKMLGCLITALAAAQGAPFWFDILAKLVNVRSSGIRPARAAESVG